MREENLSSDSRSFNLLEKVDIQNSEYIWKLRSGQIPAVRPFTCTMQIGSDTRAPRNGTCLYDHKPKSIYLPSHILRSSFPYWLICHSLTFWQTLVIKKMFSVIYYNTTRIWFRSMYFYLYIYFYLAPPQPTFEFLPGLYTFPEASLACQLIGGQLAVLTNPVSVSRAQEYLSSL